MFALGDSHHLPKAPVAVPVSLERTMEGHYDLIWSRRGRKRTVERSIRLKPDEKRVIKHWKDLK